MTYPATVYRVLIGSPSDVNEERAAAARAVHDWNIQHSKARGIVLLPVMWETHSAPLLGDRAQAVINGQLVRECDMLIGVFWTRIGSPTGEAESGTIEEINWFLAQKKPVMLYFSNKDLPKNCDLDQVQRLRDFNKQIKTKGLIFDFDTPHDLEAKIARQVTTIVNTMIVTPTVNFADLKRASRETESKGGSEEDNLKVRLYEYSEKSFVVAGDTVKYKEKFKDWNGKWTKTRNGTLMWLFGTKNNIERVANLLKVKPVLAPYPEK